MHRSTVYHKPGRFAGWPANNGVWQYGDEIVVGFNEGALDPSRQGMHPISRDEPQRWTRARSPDGGENWGDPEVDLAVAPTVEPRDCPGDIPFNDDFALRFMRTSDADGAQSYFYLSPDRCRTWLGPYEFGAFHEQSDFPGRGIVARTDYQVLGERELVAFVAAVKSDGLPAHAFCAHTSDGCRTWTFRSWIGPRPGMRSYMPSTVRLSDSRFLAALRRREEDGVFIDLYESLDTCRTWRHVCAPVPDLGGANGNPPALVRLKDGRLVLTYGSRGESPGIRGIVSDDSGRTWDTPRVLRAGAVTPDLGYSRSVQRPDGNVVTVYYFNEEANGERFIEATVWHPDENLPRSES